MFFVGFAALFMASLGFWKLKEVIPSKLTVKSPRHFLQLIRTELKNNGKLCYFLEFINTMGISISLLPFVILYAKENFNTQSDQTSTFLLFKVIGSVAAGLLLFALAGKFRYRHLLFGNTALAVVIPLIILLSPVVPSFTLIFLIGGIVFAVYNITMNGILLEVSGTENRALYTGIAGAGNILPALFPLIGGWIIKHNGFLPFFVLYLVIIVSSLYFIHKINCKK